jgi:hypothetical protein
VGERRKERTLRGEEGQSILHNTYEDSIMKPTKYCLTKGRERRGNGNMKEEVS